MCKREREGDSERDRERKSDRFRQRLILIRPTLVSPPQPPDYKHINFGPGYDAGRLVEVGDALYSLEFRLKWTRVTLFMCHVS